MILFYIPLSKCVIRIEMLSQESRESGSNNIEICPNAFCNDIIVLNNSSYLHFLCYVDMGKNLFIYSGYFYSTSSSPLLLRVAPDYSIDTVSELTCL